MRREVVMCLFTTSLRFRVQGSALGFHAWPKILTPDPSFLVHPEFGYLASEAGEIRVPLLCCRMARIAGKRCVLPETHEQRRGTRTSVGGASTRIPDEPPFWLRLRQTPRRTIPIGKVPPESKRQPIGGLQRQGVLDAPSMTHGRPGPRRPEGQRTAKRQARGARRNPVEKSAAAQSVCSFAHRVASHRARAVQKSYHNPSPICSSFWLKNWY